MVRLRLDLVFMAVTRMTWQCMLWVRTIISSRSAATGTEVVGCQSLCVVGTVLSENLGPGGSTGEVPQQVKNLGRVRRSEKGGQHGNGFIQTSIAHLLTVQLKELELHSTPSMIRGIWRNVEWWQGLEAEATQKHQREEREAA